LKNHRNLAAVIAPHFFCFFARQALGNPIEQHETELRRDKGPAVPVQNIFKKVKKNLVRGQILN
jgi:hypothetical protein